MKAGAALRAAFVLQAVAGCAHGAREREEHRAPPTGAVFPTLPTSVEAANALVRAETRRAPAERAEIDAHAIVAAIDAKPSAFVAGDAAITQWVQARLANTDGAAYVLFGTWHDAPGQIDAFRRLVGPGGIRGLDVIAVELFRSDGAWSGAPAEAQRGDTEPLDRYQQTGDREAFAKLARDQRDANYIAWKLGFEAVALDLATTARATGVALRGCDMPSALQAQTNLPHGELLHRVREIHCARTLSTPTPPRRAALLWGDAHLRPSGLASFLPASATVLPIHFVGQRIEPGAIESALAKELAITEPVLVPIGADEAVIVLPDATLSARIDRVLTTRQASTPVALALSVRGDGRITIDGRTASLTADAKGLDVAPGDHGYVLERAGGRVIGAVRIEPGHDVELGFEADGSVTYLERR